MVTSFVWPPWGKCSETKLASCAEGARLSGFNEQREFEWVSFDSEGIGALEKLVVFYAILSGVGALYCCSRQIDQAEILRRWHQR
jgi:hypothetical protein